MAFELPIDQPFNLELTLSCAQGHRWRFSADYNGSYSSVIDGHPVWVSQDRRLGGKVEFETTADAASMEEKLRDQFRLDDNIISVYDDLYTRNPMMAELVRHYEGLRVMRVDPWECLVFSIFSARTSMEGTRRKMDKIAEVFATGPALENDIYPFPKPEDVGSPLGKTKLDKLTFYLVGGKDYLETVNHYVYEAGLAAQSLGVWLPDMPRGSSNTNRHVYQAPDGINFDLLKQYSLRDALTLLRKIPGVGARAANCVALFGLGHLDAFPIDSNVLRTLKSIFLDHPYAGYTSQFLYAEGLKGKVEWDHRQATREYR